MNGFITVFYTCRGCCRVKEPCTVRTRYSDEILSDWIKEVRRSVTNRHRIVSPECPYPNFDLAIPLNQDDHSPVGSEVPGK